MNTLHTKISGSLVRHRILGTIFTCAAAILLSAAGSEGQSWAIPTTVAQASSASVPTPPTVALVPVGGVPAIPKGALSLGPVPARANIRVDIALTASIKALSAIMQANSYTAAIPWVDAF